jgi:polyhydroxybutyrate depolymerase
MLQRKGFSPIKRRPVGAGRSPGRWLSSRFRVAPPAAKGYEAAMLSIVRQTLSALAMLILAGLPDAHADGLISGGIQRQYFVFRPSGAAGPLPAVFLLHGGQGTAEGLRRYTGFDRLAEEAGILAVYPQGVDRNWNDQRGVGGKSTAADDRFLLDLADHLAAAGQADRRRIYVAGISNGGIMALQMACSHAESIAGIAVIAASLPVGFQCQPARPLPVIFFNGTEDRFIPFTGGPIAGQFAGDRGSVVPVQDSVDFFARFEGCRSRASETIPDPVPPDGTHARRNSFGGCRPGGALESVVIDGGGHSWPGADQGIVLTGILGRASRAIDANRALWRFFADNPP